MPNNLVHKLYKPSKVEPKPLFSLILCWHEGISVLNILVSTSIYQVTCPDCINRWKSGIYQ